MRVATRLFPAIVILAGFFLIRIWLYRLPSADVFRGSNSKSLFGVGDDDPTEVKGDEDLITPTTASKDERIGVTEMASATATAQKRPSTTTVAQEEVTATRISLDFLDQVVVIGKTEKEDTSWVEKLPTSVFSAAWILPCDKC
jgi:hypothetical protein